MVPSDLKAKLVFPYPQLTTEDVCPAPRPREHSGPGTHFLTSPNSSVTFLGCWPGTVTVRLLTVSDDTLLTSIQVTIRTPRISISGLYSSLAKDTNVSFTVTASNLSASQTYSIEALAGDADIGFGSEPGSAVCSPLSASSEDLSGQTEYTEGFTLHACNEGGSAVFASVLHGTGTIGFTSKYLRVTPAPTAPPTGLTLSLEGEGDLRLDYTEASILGGHFFELHRSETRDGTYTRPPDQERQRLACLLVHAD